jgi:hypothetical protein
MYQNVLNGIDGIGLYGVISICIFFSFFTGMLLWAFVQKKNHLNRMAELPLDGGETKSTDKTQA